MGRKKKETVAEPEPDPPLDFEIIIEMDTIYQALKEKWFELAATEKIGYTKELTKRIDKLQQAIVKRKQDIKDEYN
jgi:hypothetical protein